MLISEHYSNNNNATTFTVTTPHFPGIITLPLIPYAIHRNRRNQQLLGQFIEQRQQNRNSGERAAQRRRRRLVTKYKEDNYTTFYYPAQQVASLYQGYGTHYVDIWCGTPPQRQTLIVDTGSSVTAFPCSQCNDCGVPDYHIDPLYNESASSTFRKLSCNECLRGKCKNDDTTDSQECLMSQGYQEGSSWTAYEAMDSCYVGGLHSSALGMSRRTTTTNQQQQVDDLNPFDAKYFQFNLKFGCQKRVMGLFKTQMADGVMGVDFGPSSFWYQMYQSKIIAHKSFSLCYSRPDTTRNNNIPMMKGATAGAISFGGSDPRLHTSAMVYSKTTNKTEDGQALFTVSIKHVWLRSPGGGTSAKSNNPNSKYIQVDISKTDVPSTRIIVDSGTTDTYFSNSFGNVFSEAWEKMMGTRYDNFAVSLSPDELDNTYPTILLQLNGDRNVNRAIQDQHNSWNANTTATTGSNTTTAVTNLAYDIDPKHPYDVIIAIPPSHYFEYDDETKKYISRFYTNDPRGGVLGANVMIGHDINFDIERNRIGWAESSCDYETVTKNFIDPLIRTFSENDIIINNNKPAVEQGNKEEGKNAAATEKITEPSIDSLLLGIVQDEVKGLRDNSGLPRYDPFDIEFCSKYTCQVIISASFLGIAVVITWRILQRKSTTAKSSKNGINKKPTSG